MATPQTSFTVYNDDSRNNLSVNTLNTSNLNITGTLSVSGGFALGTEIISAAGALSPSIPVSIIDVPGVLNFGLAAGAVAGTQKYIITRAASQGVVTMAMSGASNTAEFAGAGECLHLIWDGVSWSVLARSSGAAQAANAIVAPVLA